MHYNNGRRRDLSKYIGDYSQIFGIKDYRLNGGRADGMRAMDVKNGSGLEFTVLTDRALDIASLSWKGKNMSFLSKVGVASPQYFSEKGDGFLRNFYGGFLTTCGLRQVGSACHDMGEELGLHGRISNTPAEEVCASTEWDNDEPVMRLKGKMREAVLFGEYLTLEREITCKYGENRIIINDVVENTGFREEPLMLLYHFNLGYPLLSEKSYMITPGTDVVPIDEEAEKGLDKWMEFQKPTPDYKEQVFYHDLTTEPDGKTYAGLFNPVEKMGIIIHFNKKQLGRLTQWKQMGEGDYVLGIEPCNCPVGGRTKARQDGTLEFIQPGERRTFNLVAEIIESEDGIR